MAVDARQMNLLPSNLIRDFKPTGHLWSAQMDCGIPYQSSAGDPVNTDSGVTYHLAGAVQRKRPRDSFDNLSPIPVTQKTKLSSFIDDDMILQIQQHQSEIDLFFAEHAEKMAMELEKRRRQETRMVVLEIYKGIATKMKEKDEEIQRVGKLNWLLQERMKSLCVENQLWRDMAQTNEATAKSLRTDLQKVMAHVRHEHRSGGAESSCGSSDSGRQEAAPAKSSGGTRMCRKCGDRESCVLVLPCRHLCMCTRCGSRGHTCPLCNSAMDASVHVNMSWN